MTECVNDMNFGQIQKQGNALLILRLLRYEPLSRAELSRKTGLTRAAITGIVDSLINEGLLREGTVEKTSFGRRPTMLELSPEAYYSVGIDLARDGVRLCILDFSMKTVFECFWSSETDREVIIDGIVKNVLDFKTNHTVLGMGIVSPGPVDSGRGKILEPSGFEAWHGFDIGIFSERCGLEAVLQKDTAALAVAEKRFKGADSSFLVLLADHGLGGGFIYKGELFESSFGSGCEIGHISIDIDGEKCSCGNRGCAELYASVPSALKAAKKKNLNYSWCELVNQKNKLCTEILEKQAEALASVCISAVNMLEPEMIILEGELCFAFDFMKSRIEKVISERCFTENGKKVCVEASSLPKNARAFSAANLVFEKYFGR